MSTPGLTSANFWQRWPLHQQTLRHLSQCFLGEQSSDAEDAVTSTLLRALQRLQSSSVSVHNERAWLIRILHNVCMDMHRHHGRFVEPALPVRSEQAGGQLDALPQEVADSPEEALLVREQSEELWTHIQALPPTLRTPLIMRFYLDMSYPEISAALNLTNCNVRKRIQFANDRLRIRLGAPARGSNPSVASGFS